MTKRDTGFLLIGLGIGLTFATFAIDQIFKSLVGGAQLNSYTIERVVFLIPSLLLLAGAILLLWKPRRNQRSNSPAVDTNPGHDIP